MRQKQTTILIFTVLFLFGSLFTNSMDVRAETLASTIVNDANSYVGKLPYGSPGNSLTAGVDCSGFVCAIFEKYGYNLWGNRTSLRNLPSSIATNIGTNINNALPGDIICTSGHVGIYAGDGLLINAANANEGVVKKKCSYYGTTVAIMRVNGVVQQLTPTPTPSTTPVISNIIVKDVDSTGYTIQCTATDSKGINRVQFPTWTEANGQDDLFSDWGTASRASGTKNGDVYTYRVNASQHNNEEGMYITHIYAISNSGVEGYAWGTGTYIDKTKPQISNVQIINVDSDGYTVQCTVTDNYAVDRVQFPTWTTYNGQDDLLQNWTTSEKAKGTKNGNTYTFRVNTSEHNNEKGEYETHIYAFDSCGNVGFKEGVPLVNIVEKTTDNTGNETNTGRQNTNTTSNTATNDTDNGSQSTNNGSKSNSTSKNVEPKSNPISYGRKYQDSKGNIYYAKSISASRATLVLYQANEKIKQIVIPASVTINGIKCSVTTIGEKAFSGCKNLTKVTLPATVTAIHKNAFPKNTKCKTIIIKSSKIKSIGKNSFRGVYKKATITLPKKNYNSQQKKLLKSGVKKTVKIKKVR